MRLTVEEYFKNIQPDFINIDYIVNFYSSDDVDLHDWELLTEDDKEIHQKHWPLFSIAFLSGWKKSRYLKKSVLKMQVLKSAIFKNNIYILLKGNKDKLKRLKEQ